MNAHRFPKELGSNKAEKLSESGKIREQYSDGSVADFNQDGEKEILVHLPAIEAT